MGTTVSLGYAYILLPSHTLTPPQLLRFVFMYRYTDKCSVESLLFIPLSPVSGNDQHCLYTMFAVPQCIMVFVVFTL